MVIILINQVYGCVHKISLPLALSGNGCDHSLPNLLSANTVYLKK